MSISSISSSTLAPQAIQKPEALETGKAGPDHDGDSDDRAAVNSAPKPVVNTSGQTTGLVVNTKA